MPKYSNRKTVVDGIVFDSKREANRWQELKLLEKLGEITGLERQVKWVLLPKQKGEREVNYFADFQYFDKDGRLHVLDSKGFKTKDYVIKRKMLLYFYGVRIEEV